MKKLLFIAVSAIIATTVAVLNVTPIRDTKQPEVQEVVQIEVIQPVEEIQPEITVIEPIIENTVQETVIVEQPTVDYAQIMLESFIHRKSVYVFIDRYLKPNYPERFTDENLLATVEYLVGYFADKNDIEVSRIHSTFTW